MASERLLIGKDLRESKPRGEQILARVDRGGFFEMTTTGRR
jgi:hypothetical protein